MFQKCKCAFDYNHIIVLSVIGKSNFFESSNIIKNNIFRKTIFEYFTKIAAFPKLPKTITK